MNKFYAKFGCLFAVLLFLSLHSYGQGQTFLKKFQKISNGNGGFSTTKNIISNDDRFGGAVANIGDLNGDGIEDLAVGASFNDDQGTNFGCVYILFMNSSGTVNSFKQIYPPSTYNGAGRFGVSVCKIGDLDGDGVQDLAVGNLADNSFQGGVVICFMKTDGTVKSQSVINFQTTNFTSALYSGVQFGTSVEAIGDYNKDGILDIAVGAPLDADGAATKKGAIYLIYLTKAGGVKGFSKISDLVGSVPSGTLKNGMLFGTAICNIGDVDGDGNTDLMVGGSGDNSGDGCVFLLRMKSTGVFKRASKISIATSILLSTAGIAQSFFGTSIAKLTNFKVLGDSMLAVGCPSDTVGGTGRGSVIIFKYDTAGNVLYYNKINSRTKLFSGQLANNDRFGSALANYGNKDTTSTQAFVVGAPNRSDGYDNTSNTAIKNSGAVFIQYFRKFDIAVNKIQYPHDTICANTVEPIAVFIKNNSFQALSNIPFSFTAYGQGAGTDTFSVQDTFKKTLGVGASDTMKFAKPLRTSKGGTYKLVINSNQFGDFYANDDTVSKNIFINAILSPINLGRDSVLCAGQSITLDAKNVGANYKWSTGATTQTINVNTKGTYWVKASLGPCFYTDTIKISYNKSAVVKLGRDTTLCSGQTIKYDAGYPDAKHLWSTGDTNQVITVTAGNTYTAYVIYNQCFYTDTVNVSYVTTKVNLGRDTTLCDGQAYVLNGTAAGSTYLWSTGATTAKVTATTSGTYWVQVKTKQCFTSDTAIVNFLKVPVVALGPDTTLCQGQSIQFDAGNVGYTRKWSVNSDTSRFLTASSPGTYSVLVTNKKCSSSDTVTVKYINLNANLGRDTALCQGQTYKLGTGLKAANPTGTNFFWSDNSTAATLDVTQSGKYWVELTNKQCSVSDTAIVTFKSISPIYLGKDSTLCPGQTIILDAGNSGLSHLWSNGDTTQKIKVSKAGTYIAIAAVGKKCIVKDTINIGYRSFQPIFAKADTILCLGTTYVLDAKNVGATSYLWSTGETTKSISVNATGTYSVTVNKVQCPYSESTKVTFIPAPIVKLGADSTYCQGTPVILDAGNPVAQVRWSTGDTSHKITVSRRGKYFVKAWIGTCIAYDTVRVAFYDPLALVTPHEIFLCNAIGDTLDAGVANFYKWFPNGETTRKIFVTSIGTYKVTSGYSPQCTYTDTVQVSECPPKDVYIPTAFSPDEDGLNDVFTMGNKNVVEFQMNIYTRWGELLYSTNDVNKGWDGKYRGTPVTEDQYIYTIVYRLKTPDGTPPQKIISGAFVLIRH